ncbi:MAG: maintenance system killer protein [Prevotella sp.]|nr:maintenance system killer protein [Prevotella sp.]
MEQRKPIHFKEAQQLLDIARETHQKVNILAWELKGNIIEYRGWMVSSSSWRKGWHRIINPVNNEIRTVPDIFIIKINGHQIYL